MKDKTTLDKILEHKQSIDKELVTLKKDFENLLQEASALYDNIRNFDKDYDPRPMLAAMFTPSGKVEELSVDRSKLTTEGAILKAFDGVKELKVADIHAKAVELKGKNISKDSIRWTLNKLKNEKLIVSAGHGIYKLTK